MGRQMLCSVRAALAEGWEVTVINAPGGLHPPGVEVHKIDVTPVLRLARLTPARFSPAWIRLLSEWTHGRRSRRLIGRPDVFQGSVGCILEPLRAARSAEAVTIAECMNAHARHQARVMRREEESAGSGAHFHNRWTVARSEAEYAAADRVLCSSRYTRRTLIEGGVGAGKIGCIPLAVEMPAESARHEPTARFRALFVGSLDLRKGFRYLLRAWELLRLPRAELYLRGGTGDRPCRKLLEGWRRRLEFTVDGEYGPVPYQEFSVLVLPSVCDQFPQVVPEAMAAGLPVIVSENAGSAECVREGVDGFVVPVADAEAIAARLEVLYRDRGRLAEMGRSARARATGYSFEAFRARYAAQVRAWMAARGRGTP